MGEKIAFLGGSFNPVHQGHIAVAKAVRQEFDLDRVLLITAKDPPHKQVAGNVDARIRHEMAVLAMEGQEGLEASDLELRRGGKSYTVDTIRALMACCPDAEIYCVIGADMLLDLPRWHAPETLFRLGNFIGVARPGVLETLNTAIFDMRRRYGANIRLSSFHGPDISSTDLRERVYAAMPIEGMTPVPVERYIYEAGLYQPEEIRAMQHKLKESLQPKRYLHSMGVVRCAIGLAARYGENTEKARLAALLHDCAKLDLKEQVAMARCFGLDLSVYETISKAVLHGPLGAELARCEYGVNDPAVLDAIRYHTVCRRVMTKLDKIIYLADKIEPGRDYEGLLSIRAAAERSLDEGVLACMEHSIAYARQKEGKKLHPGILEAWAYLQKQKEEML